MEKSLIKVNVVNRKNIICLFVILSMFFFLGSFKILAVSDGSIEREEFRKALEKELVKNLHYYDPNTATLLDSIVTNGHVKKIITVDDPETKENEEVVDEYDSPLVVGYIKAKQRRDSFFLFDNTNIYYYSLDKKEFIENDQIIGNQEVSDFYKKYSSKTYTKITSLSFTILMLMISLIIIVPIFIMIFHNKSRGTVGFPKSQYVETSNTHFNQ